MELSFLTQTTPHMRVWRNLTECAAKSSANGRTLEQKKDRSWCYQD